MQTLMEEIETHWENYVERKMQESEERANAKPQGKFCLDYTQELFPLSQSTLYYKPGK